MKKTFKKVLALILSLAMVFSSAVLTSAAEGEAPVQTLEYDGLQVGAGEAEIDYSVWNDLTTSAFPEARKGFGVDSIHDNPHARVILIDNGEERTAIVSLEIVSITSDLAAVKSVVSEILSVKEDNIWVHCTHSVTTPHSDSSDAYVKIITDAVKEACEEALKTFEPAVMGVSSGTCDINSNRNIVEPEGAKQVAGSRDTTFYSAPNVTSLPNNEDMEIVGDSNEKMTVIGFQSKATGKPITYYVSYGVKPNTIDAVGFSTGGSRISSDTPGFACSYAEESVDVPVMFCMSAAGDQTTDMSAKIYGFDENGDWAYLELGTFNEVYNEMVVPLGTKMGTSMLDIINTINYDQDDPEISVEETSFSTTKTDGTTVDVPVSAMTIGNVALVGVQAEIDADTEIQLQEDSPYDYTCLVSFMNGDDKYMPHSEAYDYNDGKGTYEVFKTTYTQGTAEEMVDTAVELLNEIKYGLQVGAGEAEIDYSVWNELTTNAFPEARKGFGVDSIHDNPHARVILLDNGDTRSAIVSLEIVQISNDLDAVKSAVSEALDVDKDNIWVHCTHSVTTPHSDDSEAYVKIITDAVKEACAEALETLEPAVMAVTAGTCDINSNRNIDEPEGAKQVSGSRDTTFYSAPNITSLVNNEDMEIVGESNEKMTVAGFYSATTGEPITYYVSYGVKPNTIDALGFSTAGSMISSDTPGYACTYAESTTDVPVVFCMSAAGDQTTDMSAKIYGFDENGEWAYLELADSYKEAYNEMVVPLGTKMGTSILDIVDELDTMAANGEVESAPVISFASTTFTAETTSGTSEVPVSTMTIGEKLALVGVQPEIDAATDLALQAASPYEYTCLVSFMNGDGKYMPHAEAYDYNDGKGTYEVFKTNFVKGTAEQMVNTAVDLLNGDYVLASESIESIFAFGSMEVDGAKASKIVLTYDRDIDPDSVSLDSYAVTDYGTVANPSCSLGENPGKPVSVDVEGNQVVITLNTDYQLVSAANYKAAMAAGATQLETIYATDGTPINPDYKAVSNYTVTTSEGNNGTTYTFTVEDGTYYFTGLEGYTIYDGENAFHATNCYSETYSDYQDVDLPYALYVPEDYDPNGKYALTVYIPDSGANGDDVMLGLTTTKAAANLASEDVQNMVKEQGLDGMIVLVPQYSATKGNTAWKVTSDNFTVSYGLPATWQLLDSLTKQYSIDTNRIYGIGQSQGGMMIACMASQRDNYFAGLWEIGCEWGNNYNKEVAYGGATYGTSEDATIWNEDWANWYYYVSDDNMLITTCEDDAFATSCYKEFVQVYSDFADVEIPIVNIDPLKDSVSAQNKAYEVLTKMSNKTNIYWALQANGGHNETWVYAHKTMAAYEWLFSQTQEAENEREKLEILANDYVPETDEDVIAASQTADRQLSATYNGEAAYYAVPAEGSGTKGYNSTLFGRGAKTIERLPGYVKYESVESNLNVGAGEAEIDFSVWSELTESAFPEARKGFGVDSIHDNPHARVILIDNGEERVAIVSLEIVQISSDLSAVQEAVSEALNVETDNVWVHCTHSVTTPHSDGSEAYVKIITDAVKEACAEALETYQPAVMGIEQGTCTINSNRNIVEPEGAEKVDGSRDTTFYSAPNITSLVNNEDMEIVGESNETMTVVGFVSAETGDPITYYVSYGVKPNTIDALGFSTAGSMISSDTPGYACTYAESSTNVPVVFCMSAAGDQTTDMSAKIYGFDENGKWAYLELADSYEEAYDSMVVPLGTQMGNDILSIIKNIEYDETDPEIAVSSTTFTAETTDGKTSDVPVSAMTIGDLALVGVQPEIDAATDILLQESSPYEYTCLISFMNGDGKYMPHSEAYDYNDGKGTYEVFKTSYVQGTAEKMVSTAVGLLGGEYKLAGDEIESVYVIGSMEADGAKAQAIAVEYKDEIAADSVDLEDFEITDYMTVTGSAVQIGDQSTAGTATKVYVNDAAEISENGGTKTGKYVIIELNTDYVLSSVPAYKSALAGGVTQLGDIQTADGQVINGDHQAVNNYTCETSESAQMDGSTKTTYTFTVEDGTYELNGIEGYKIYDGENAFHATNCYSETYSDYQDVTLPYALYVPEDYKADGKYALTVYIPDSGANGDDVMLGLTTTQAAANLASEEVQNMIKEQGYDGMIVLVPQFSATKGNTAWKVTSDNFTVSYGLPATWQLMDYLTKEYSIDTGRIYGIGQSQGGMMLACMASQRDNYFAGLWQIGCEWGNNYNKEVAYSGATYGTSEDATIWNEDWANWYYYISDDNMLVTTCEGDAFASSCYRELVQVYSDFADVSIPIANMDPINDSVATQNRVYKVLTKTNNQTNIYWALLDGGDHNATWVYAHRTSAAYEWLFSQTQEAENEREKLEILANDYVPETDEAVIAAAQTADRQLSATYNGEAAYYAVPAEGSGTKGYNSTLFGRGAKTIERLPGYVKPEGFTDISDCSDGVQTAINWAADNGIVAGYTDISGIKTFEPTADCTRAQMAVMLYRLAGKPAVTDEQIAAAQAKFSDISEVSAGALKAIAWAVSEGIINGYSDGTFKPEDSISRESTVVMLWRMAGKPVVEATATFTDTASCSAGVMKAINWAASVGITKGSANGDGTYKFAPKDNCQRQHIATFVYRYAQKVNK